MGLLNKERAFSPSETCEALGDDHKWYKAKVVGENADGTFACILEEFGATWSKVPLHNLRKLQKRERRKVVVSFDESFSEFDEKPTMTAKVERSKNLKSGLSVQISSVLEDYERIHRALSCIGSEFGETSAKAETENGRLKVTITSTQEISERRLTILLPESPTYSCGNPFSWLFGLAKRKGKPPVSAKKKDRKKKVKQSLEETIQDDALRGSNLYHGSAKKLRWNEDDLQLYQNEIQAEINRLRNTSSVYAPPQVSNDSIGDMFMRLSAESYGSWENVNHEGKRPENVVWLTDGTMIKAEARERGATYFLEDPYFDESKSLPYVERLKLSNQWDVDSTMISSSWSKGNKVEVWLESGWLPATIQDCFVEENKSKLRVLCNQSVDASPHVVDRFGTQVRPWGYLEVDSDDENSEST